MNSSYEYTISSSDSYLSTSGNDIYLELIKPIIGKNNDVTIAKGKRDIMMMNPKEIDNLLLYLYENRHEILSNLDPQMRKKIGQFISYIALLEGTPGYNIIYNKIKKIFKKTDLNTIRINSIGSYLVGSLVDTNLPPEVNTCNPLYVMSLDPIISDSETTLHESETSNKSEGGTVIDCKNPSILLTYEDGSSNLTILNEDYDDRAEILYMFVNTLSYHYISGLTIPEKKFISNFCDLPIKIYGYGYLKGRITFKLLKQQPLSINDIKTRVSNIVLTKNIDNSFYDYTDQESDDYYNSSVSNQTDLVSLIGILTIFIIILIIMFIFYIWYKDRNRNIHY